MRAAQPEGARGSLKWMQRAVDEKWAGLERPILDRILGARSIEWLSPLRSDDRAEYRDGAFLDRLGLSPLAPALAAFWPARGPQWDALGRIGGGQVLLVEAKAHVAEFCTPATAAGPESRARIAQALGVVATALGSARGDAWPDIFYQYANRLAHLHFLREAGVDAYLVLVGFLGDADMRGPDHAETWAAAYLVADHALGLKARHPLAPYIVHVFPEVSQ